MAGEWLEYRRPEKPHPLWPVGPVEWVFVCVVGAILLYALFLVVVVLLSEDSPFYPTLFPGA